jgi:hypothetical protein
MEDPNPQPLKPISLAYIRTFNALYAPETAKTFKNGFSIEMYDTPLLNRKCKQCISEEFRQLTPNSTSLALAICLGCGRIVSLI